MPRPPIWYLQKIELFKDMTDEEIGEVIQGMEAAQYPCKHRLYSADDTVDKTFILKEGEVTLYKDIGDRTIVVDILKPGSVFGNLGLETNMEEGSYAEITARSFVCELPKDFFIQLLTKRPTVAVRALEIVQKRLKQYESQLKFLSTLSAKDRILAAVALINQKDDNSILPAILRMPTKITHEKLASMTGLTRETVTKQLKELQESGLLTVKKKDIRLTEDGQMSLSKA